MPIFTSGNDVIVTPPPEFVPQTQPQPQYLGLEYIDPDGNSWNLMDLDMADGLICTDINGLSGVPPTLQTIPLVTGGAIPQLYILGTRTITMSVFIMALNGALGQNDYLKKLDAFTVAFTNVRSGMPSPGTLVVTRPDGTSRQCQVFCTAGIDQPNDSTQSPSSGLLWTTYVLTLTGTDPFFYDVSPTEFTFEVSPPSNVLSITDFEDGVDGYTGANSAVVAQSGTYFHTGTNSLSMHGNGSVASPEALGVIFPATPGATYDVTAFLSASATLTSIVKVGFLAIGPDGVTVVSTNLSSAFTVTGPPPAEINEGFSFMVPTDGTIEFLQPVFQITGTPGSGTILYIDAVTVSVEPGILPLLPITLVGPTTLGSSEIVNGGTTDAYPVWTITGPGTPIIENVTTGKSWTLSAPLASLQQIVVNTTPGQQSVTDVGTGDSLWGELVVGTPRDLWPIVPGQNELNLAVSGATSASRIDISVVLRWLRA